MFRESELLWTNKNCCPLGTHFLMCLKPMLSTSSSFSVPDGGIGRRPAEQPSDCQHPGHRRQWQHAHVCQGLLQCWGLHRHAAGGNRSPGNRNLHAHSHYLFLSPLWSPPRVLSCLKSIAALIPCTVLTGTASFSSIVMTAEWKRMLLFILGIPADELQALFRLIAKWFSNWVFIFHQFNWITDII